MLHFLKQVLATAEFSPFEWSYPNSRLEVLIKILTDIFLSYRLSSIILHFFFHKFFVNFLRIDLNQHRDILYCQRRNHINIDLR